MHEFKNFSNYRKNKTVTPKNVEKPNKQTKTKRKNNIQKSVPEINAFCYFVFSQQFK